MTGQTAEEKYRTFEALWGEDFPDLPAWEVADSPFRRMLELAEVHPRGQNVRGTPVLYIERATFYDFDRAHTFVRQVVAGEPVYELLVDAVSFGRDATNPLRVYVTILVMKPTVRK